MPEDTARARFRQVKAYLAEARRSLDLGDVDGARNAVECALQIDPDYLAAHALRDRIAAGPQRQSETSAVSPSGLANIEERARKRRIAHRIQTARKSLDAGDTAEARAAVAELAEIDPDGAE